MSFLSDILERKHKEVADRRRLLPEAALSSLARAQPPCRGFAQALSRRGEPLRAIAEIKRASPSIGPIRSDLDPASLARRYETAGAAAISVLTDGPGFGGSLKDLVAVRSAVSLPVLRKDFLIAPYQLFEARAAGADSILLIAAALAPSLLVEMLAASRELGLDALVEVHDAVELERALEAGATLIGINNRDLSTFEVDLATSEALLPRVPDSVRAVTESGVRGRAEAERLRRAGAANLLVGEALVRVPDPEALLRGDPFGPMNDVKVKVCGLTRAEDALEAARLGADAVGFNFWRGSRRYIRPARAWKIIRELPPFLTVVGVFVNASREEIRRIAGQCRLDLVQLHGDESATFCARLGLSFVKAVRFTGPYSLPPMRRFPGALLVDTPTPGFGGSGQTFDWNLIQEIAKERRIVLAGGLTAKNVAQAIETVRPYAVDVASGIESSPGIKDRAKMAQFIRVAKGIA